MGNTPSEFIGSFFLYNILFFLSIIDNKINIKNKPEQLCYVCPHNLSHFVTNNNNKFKKENGDKMNACSCITCSIIIINSKRYLETKNNKLFNHCVSIYMSRTCFNLYCTVIHLLIPRSNGF